MFTPYQYRAKAAEYTDLAKTARNPAEVREFQTLEARFTVLADNEQWLVDNHDKTIHPGSKIGSAGDEPSATEQQHVLQCLGAALIMQWNTLPSKLQRELFDNAGIIDEMLNSTILKGHVERFLLQHKEGEDSQTRLPM